MTVVRLATTTMTMEAPSSSGALEGVKSVDVLILGAGWTSTFLIPLLTARQIPHAATTTTGRDGTIPFRFDPTSVSSEPFLALPAAKTVLITFPLKGPGQSTTLTSLYAAAHPSHPKPQWIQLGSTGIWTANTQDGWVDPSSPYDATHPRAVAEDEIMSVADGAVLNLAGLYDHATRDPRNWLVRVAKTKDALRAKGSLHLVHGNDVARAVVAMHERFTPRRRWIITDLRVYDWWDLAQTWAPEARRRLREKGELSVDEVDAMKWETWVATLMHEEGLKALPRPATDLGRALDSTAFWRELGILPTMGRVAS
jgi:hypothetical protein